MTSRYRLALFFLGILFQPLVPTGLPAQQNWRELHGGVKTTISTVATMADGTILYGTFSDGIIQSNDGGESWWRGRPNNKPLDVAMPLAITSIISSEDGSEILAGMSTAIFRSSDRGATWTRQSTDLSEPFRNVNIAAILRLDNNRVLVGTGGNSFYRSSDMASFERTIPNDTAGMRSEFLRTANHIFAGTNQGVYRIHPDGTLDAAGLSAGMHMRPSVSALAVTEQGALLAGPDAGFYRSTDNGASWSGRKLDTVEITTILVAGNGVILAGSHTGMFRSTDNGTTWNPAIDGLESTWITSLARTPDGDIVAGTGEGVFISSDNGQRWRSAFTGIEVSAQEPSILALDSTHLFVAWGAHTRAIHRFLHGGRTGSGSRPAFLQTASISCWPGRVDRSWPAPAMGSIARWIMGSAGRMSGSTARHHELRQVREAVCSPPPHRRTDCTSRRTMERHGGRCSMDRSSGIWQSLPKETCMQEAPSGSGARRTTARTGM